MLGESSSVSVSNALINMYAKAGNINCARNVFCLIRCKRESISWSSMIMALAQHGLGEEALQLFEDMLSSYVQPDHITYVGVLSACTHVGLVEKGRTYYQMMKDVHGIQPTSSHCACIIDLFGRAGLFQEAQAIIATMPIEPDVMPIEPDVIAWGSLLAACKVHKNVDQAEIETGRLLSIEPDNSGAYSALANVYLACGKWKEAVRIRKSMKDKKVKKKQGISWVQIKSEVHVFGAEDGVHPQKYAICLSIGKIWEEIKKMGFVQDTGSVLHDLDEELKEQILKHHSEKLAISFALMNTPQNATIRIMKKLSFLIIYNCSDQLLTICERRFRKSREDAVRNVREKTQARTRWKSAKDAAVKHVAELHAQISGRFSIRMPSNPKEFKILNDIETEISDDLYFVAAVEKVGVASDEPHIYRGVPVWSFWKLKNFMVFLPLMKPI